jgi:deazaflavin-dependent oxidoreductase (nitroreductase family)
MNDYNRRIIEEFRTHGGKVGGMWEGTPLLLLTTTGAKSGERHTTPMAYLPDGDRLFVWDSNGGSPTNPDWYHNLGAHPHVTVVGGTETSDQLALGYETRDTTRSMEPGMTSIWYEILPVTLEAEQVVVLYRCEDGEAQPWLVPHQAGTSPNDAVIARLERCFGDLFEPEASIVHSTSWRYCQRTERIVLTYLVVMPQRAWSDNRVASNRILAHRLGKVEQARGDHLSPPEKIEVNNILAHALDHLAMLSNSDERINEVLESGWRGVLETRIPKPAGYVEVEEVN